MKLHKIEIKNFRNIIRANIPLKDLNIFTGKNSSGKSNFLLAISTALNTKNDYTSEFNKNNVTIGKGRSSTVFTTTVLGIGNRTCYLGSDVSKSTSSFFCLEPEMLTFEKTLDKNSFSILHRLSFKGKQYENTDPKITWNDFSRNNQIFEEKSIKIDDELVYEKRFLKPESIDGTNVVQTDATKNKHEGKYFGVFEQLQKSLISQIKPNFFNVDLGQITTALSIHKYVTDKGNEQIYQEALKRAHDKAPILSKTSLESSEFIFLIADIEKNSEISKKFQKDLETFTKGIVKGISINTNGSLSVTSPNGPDGIWTISNGTSVLVFFITLINWVNLNFNERSYQLPHIILLDETDSIVHPTILNEFIQVLRNLSRKVQIFITTHSPNFLDGFTKEEIFYIKDSASIAENSSEGMNRCNIYNYETIIKNLPEEERLFISDKKNSELFCEGIIEGIFPVKDL